jgi:hypothetical protein
MTGLDVGTFPVMSTHLLGEMGGLAAAGWLKIETHHGEFSPAFFFWRLLSYKPVVREENRRISFE